MNQLKAVQEELNRLFHVFNEHYYNGQINEPIIVIQTSGRDKRTMGWCTHNKVWKDHSREEYYYEITVCAEYLYRPYYEVCTTLLHEMAHLYCLEANIKDTSRSGTYHNKRFKAVAEAHGLSITYHATIGWSITALNEEARAFIDENAQKDVFIMTRERHTAPKPPKPPVDAPNGAEDINPEDGEENGAQGNTEDDFLPDKPKQSVRKYVCPQCGCIIRATKDVNVICGECRVAFVKEDTPSKGAR